MRTMPTPLRLLLPLLIAAAPPSVSDYRLEPAPKPRIDPRVQGPGLRPAPTPLPRDRAVTPAPPRVAPSEPRVVPVVPSERTTVVPPTAPAAQPPRSAPVPRAARPSVTASPRPAPIEPAAPALTTPSDPVPAPELDEQVPNAPVAATPDVRAPVAEPTIDGTASPAASANDAGRTSWWPLLLLGLAGAIVALALALALRRRSGTRAPVRRAVDATPEPAVTEPTIHPAAIPVRPVAAEPVAEAGQLSIALQPLEARANALGSTLKARITVANTGDRALTDLTLDVMMAGAGEVGDAELARFAADGSGGARTPLPDLMPDESHSVERSLRVGARDFRPIQLADRAIFVPLVGLTVDARAEGQPVRVTRALVVGRSAAPGAKMGPFRVDQGPRHYRELDGRPHALAS